MPTADETPQKSDAVSVAPLDGTCLAVLGTYEDEELVRLLERAGATVLRFDQGATSSQPNVERWLAELVQSQFDDVIFFSAHAVRLVCEFSRQVGRQPDVVEALKNVRIVAQGARTAAALSEFGLKASARSTSDDVDSLLELMSRIRVHGRTVALQPWNSGVNDEVAKWLERAGADVFLATVSSQAETTARALLGELDRGTLDALVFPSGAHVARFWDAAKSEGEDDPARALCKVVVLAGESAATALVERGVELAIQSAKTLRERLHDENLRKFAGTVFMYRTLAELDSVLGPVRCAAPDAAVPTNGDQPVRLAPPASAVQSALGEHKMASTDPNLIESPGSIRVRSRGVSI